MYKMTIKIKHILLVILIIILLLLNIHAFTVVKTDIMSAWEILFVIEGIISLEAILTWITNHLEEIDDFINRTVYTHTIKQREKFNLTHLAENKEELEISFEGEKELVKLFNL